MATRLRLSILDFSDVDRAGLGRLVTTLELAMLAERLGFARYWLAEHYVAYGPHSNSLMVSFAVASVTSSIRVGPAGVIMTYAHPFQVASTVRTLMSFFDERIDVGRCAGGSAPDIHEVLAREGALGDPYERVTQTLAWLRGDPAVGTVPYSRRPAPVWTLGSGTRMADLAAERGTRFCLSLTHGPEAPPPEILRRYRERFQPSAECPEPETMALVAAVCSDTEEDAVRVARGYRNAIIHRPMACTPGRCQEQLQAVRDRYGVDELVILDVASDYDARVRSLRGFAEGCALEARPASEVEPEAVV